MSRSKTGSEAFIVVIGALLGVLISIAVFCFGYWENSHPYLDSSIDRVIQIVILCLCPPSFALIASDNAHGVSLAFMMAEISLLNAMWYAVLAALLVWVRRV